MSILIKGMEMPETCYKCKFALARFDPLPTQKYKRHDFECVLTEKALTSTKRNKACPLIPAPTPHGRLIDADAIFEQWYQLNFDRKISDGTLAYWNVLLGEAPTVIEAEEAEE